MAMMIQIRNIGTQELLPMNKADDEIRKILNFDPDPDSFSAFFWWWSYTAYFNNHCEFNGPLIKNEWREEAKKWNWSEDEIRKIMCLAVKVETILEIRAWRGHS